MRLSWDTVGGVAVSDNATSSQYVVRAREGAGGAWPGGGGTRTWGPKSTLVSIDVEILTLGVSREVERHIAAGSRVNASLGDVELTMVFRA